MNCRSCNTKIPSGQKSCPACGRTPQSSTDLGSSQSDLGSSGTQIPLSESSHKPLTASKPAAAPAPGKSKKVKRKEKPAERGKFVAKPPAPAEAKPKSKPAEPMVPSLFSLDPTELRALLGEQPELLESGLTVMCGEAGQPDGQRYATDVGEIDLLAVDEAGDFVVVTVAERNASPALIGDVLQRVGWVRTHLGKDGGQVRAIVLTDGLSDDVRYAATAVAGTVDFKTYRVSLSFDDLPLS
jgi:hypothetical protein